MRFLWVLVGLTLCLFGRAPDSAATLIDFETLPGGTAIPGGTFITDQFASLGVAMFETTAATGPEIVQFGLSGQSGMNALGATGGATAFFEPIRIFFLMPVSEASVLALDVGAAGLMLEAFDAANNLLDSENLTGSGIGVDNFATLSVSAAGIDRLTIRQIFFGLQNDGYVIDDLRFNAATTVPEPPSLSTFAAAMIVLIGSKKAHGLLQKIRSRRNPRRPR